MTAQLLRSPLKNKYQLIHFNISKGRDVSTKARFDLINVAYGMIQPLQLAWLMLRHRPDIVYTNLAQSLAGFLRYMSLILIAALFDRPIVVQVIGDGFNHFYNRANRLLKWLIVLTLRRVSRFSVQAELLKTQFTGLVPPNKLHVVYSGIDVNEFDQPRTHSRNGRLQILFVGYLTQAKGAFDLLRAVPRIATKYPDVTFQLMGSKIDKERNVTYVDNPDSNEATLQHLLTQKEIVEHVEFLGVQTGEEKIKTFTNADIFVLPSYSESFPTVVLEAMAAGLPVIATHVGALPEVFDKRSVLFIEPGNVPQLAEAILELAQRPDFRQKMAICGQELVQKRFNIDTFAAGFDRLFSEVLST